MKSVRFTKSGSPTFVALGVGGPVEARGPSGLRVAGGPILETVSFLRADTAKIFNRGNVTWQGSFTVWREHLDIESAQDFLMLHPAELPTADDMVCEVTLNNGAVRYLTTPFIEIQDSNIKGSRTEHTYRLTGGRLQISISRLTKF